MFLNSAWHSLLSYSFYLRASLKWSPDCNTSEKSHIKGQTFLNHTKHKWWKIHTNLLLLSKHFIVFHMTLSKRYWKSIFYNNMSKKINQSISIVFCPVVTNNFISSGKRANVHLPTHYPIWWHGWGTALYPTAMHDTQIVRPRQLWFNWGIASSDLKVSQRFF